eukprot:NODE_366_length_10082_cov_0.124211.p4 type:complete len:291 gc:universal NODE_366_length_10082_cov_0.124211:4614-5486(+)
MASLQSNFPISCYPVSAPAEFQFDFTEENAHSDNVHAMLFDYNDLNRIGLDGYLICSIDALNQDLCSKDQLGSFIAGNTNSIPLKGGKQTIPVNKSGYWCMVHDATQSPKINIVNQQLQLPAPYLPLLNFYYYMTVIYLGLGIYYMVNSIKHLGTTTKLNYYILGMIWMSMLEMALGYGYYMYWGTYGATSPLLLFLFAVLTSGRNSILLLTFHSTCKQVLKRYKLYLSLYGLSSFVYFLHVLNPQQEHVLFFVALPLALLSTVFVNHILAHAQPQLMQLFSITGILLLT